ncbi:MAG: peroxidase-related enzyme [Bradymonadaceae bacterium]
MAWIETIDEAEATGELADLYDEIARERGKVANIMQVHSLAPDAMRAHIDLYTALMFDGADLPREECELIATVVSAANGCEYCIEHHGVALNAYWRDGERVRALVEDWRSLDLQPRRRAMLAYAEALTETPADVEESHVERLRETGLSEDEILAVNLIASYFNFVNRIAEGLGVEVDEDERQGYEY